MVAPPRLEDLPYLGLGISAEFGNRPTIDPRTIDAEHPGVIDFVEFGSDIDRGLDPAILHWVDSGRRATYHFLDLNIEEAEDVDPGWLRDTAAQARRLNAPWICGDAGLWHLGPRDRGHGLLLPPILTRASALSAAENISRIESETGLRVLPENPPAAIYLGDLHILEYFALVSEASGGGILLDVAHLAIFQHQSGLDPLTGLEDFPAERVVEIHVAGGGLTKNAEGFEFFEDDHRSEVHGDVWQILESIHSRARNLKALVFECEHNDPALVLPTFKRLRAFMPPPRDGSS